MMHKPTYKPRVIYSEANLRQFYLDDLHADLKACEEMIDQRPDLIDYCNKLKQEIREIENGKVDKLLVPIL